MVGTDVVLVEDVALQTVSPDQIGVDGRVGSAAVEPTLLSVLRSGSECEGPDQVPAVEFGLPVSHEKLTRLSQVWPPGVRYFSVSWSQVFEFGAAIISAGAAIAAWKAAMHAGEAADISRQSIHVNREAIELDTRVSLLGSIPIVVPWVTVRGEPRAFNRGRSVAFDLSWTIEAETMPEPFVGAGRSVLRPGKWCRLTDPRNAVSSQIATARNLGGATISCEFVTAWGEAFQVVRHIGAKQGTPSLYDATGKRITIGGSDEARTSA